MRAVTVALAAIPVLLGGLGLAFVAGGIDPLGSSVPTSEDAPLGPDSNSDDAPRESESGTPIDGQRPHLSVIDGRANLFLPAPLPEVLSLLPGGAANLNPLPPVQGGDHGSSLPAPNTGERQTAPGSDSDSGARPDEQADEQPNERPDAQPAPGPAQPPEPRPGERPAASPPWAPDVPAGRPSAPDPLTPRGDSVPRFDRDLPNKVTDESRNHGRPPHADTQGRPPHAGQTGPPGHARGNADSKGNGNSNNNGPPGRAATDNRSGRADATGRPDHADATARPDHAGGTTGRPDHAAGGAPKSDDSRPDPR